MSWGPPRPCPVCRRGEVVGLPACPACWSHLVPLQAKRHLARLRYGSAEYHDALDAVLRWAQGQLR